jgi:hypothetical protein
MPELSSESGSVHDAGREIVGESVGVRVSAEELVPETLSCGETSLVSSEAGRVTLYCTEKQNHHGDHYDKIFSVTWVRK